MITPFLLTALGAFPAPPFQGPEAPQGPLDGADLQPVPILLVQREETQLTALSRSSEPLLLLFASADRLTVAARVLRPGAALSSDFPRGALRGAWFEVLLLSGDTWRTSGALALDDGRTPSGWTAVLASGAASSAADQSAGPPWRAESYGTLVPAGFEQFLARTDVAPDQDAGSGRGDPLHVPVPDPLGRPPKGTPPKIEDRPLPPV